MARVDYHRYMASREWALKKRAVRERAYGDCERCHRPMKQVHHLSYEHLGDEPLEDLLGVCRECHEFLSGLIDWDPAEVMSEDFAAQFTIEDDCKLFHATYEWAAPELGVNWRLLIMNRRLAWFSFADKKGISNSDYPYWAHPLLLPYRAIWETASRLIEDWLKAGVTFRVHADKKGLVVGGPGLASIDLDQIRRAQPFLVAFLAIAPPDL